MNQFLIALLFSAQGALAAAPHCELELTPRHSLSPWLLDRLNNQLSALPPELIENVRTGNVGVANKALLASHNRHYTQLIPHGAILDQGSAGHCWVYGAHAMVVAHGLRASTLPRRTRLSSNYTLFWYTMEKAGDYMQGIVDAHAEPVVDDDDVHAALSRKLEEGGQFGYYQTVARRYGIVPERAMPPTHATEDSELLFRDIKDVLARFGLEVAALRRKHATAAGRLTPQRQHRFQSALRAARTRAVESTYRILALHLGVPPTTVRHRGEDLSPQQYMSEVLSFDPDDYVSISAYPMENAGTQAYRVRDLSTDGTRAEQAVYLNLSPSRYMQIINESLREGSAVLVGLDTAGPMDTELGILHPLHRDTAHIYGPTRRRSRRLNRRQRILTGSQGTGHVMVLVGFDDNSSDGNIVKYKAQNSWGQDAADRGYFHMYRPWLEIYGRDAVIHRSLLSAEELALFENPIEDRAFDRLVE